MCCGISFCSSGRRTAVTLIAKFVTAKPIPLVNVELKRGGRRKGGQDDAGAYALAFKLEASLVWRSAFRDGGVDEALDV